MMNHDYYIVRDTVEEIIEKIAKYNAKVQDIHREIAVVERYKSDVSALHLRAGGEPKRTLFICSALSWRSYL